MKYSIFGVVLITLLFASYYSLQRVSPHQTPPQVQSVTVLATGDIMLGRTVNVKSSQNDYLWAFENMNDLLSSADITVANLESPLGVNCPLTNTGMVFCADEQHAKGLEYAGIDIVNLANNHGTDQGNDGVQTTKTILQNKGIEYIGGNEQPVIKEIKGLHFAFLGYNTIFPESTELIWGYEETVKHDIDSINDTVDHVIVTIHWGNEYTTTITEHQKNLAHTAIDAGADIVIGHHPHWIQKNELYKGKPIYYSLGNFVFDQMWSQKTREGLAIRITFTEDEISQINHFPVILEDYGQPRLANEEESKAILEFSEVQPLFD